MVKVWIVQGWDEGPRAVFASADDAIAFSETCRDYRHRPRSEDEAPDAITRHYPFIYEEEVL